MKTEKLVKIVVFTSAAMVGQCQVMPEQLPFNVYDNGAEYYKFGGLKEWFQFDGSDEINKVPFFGSKIEASKLLTPGAREQHSMAQDPRTGKFYVFGGHGFDVTRLKRIHFSHILHLVVLAVF